MKKIKASVILFSILAIVVMALGITTTVTAVKAGNEYKENNLVANYYTNQAEESDNEIASLLAKARASSASEVAQSAHDELVKYFAISLLLYLAFALCVVLIVVKTTGNVKTVQS
jgi:hypothetical protein